jgi:WD40 repeat protein
VSNNGKWVVSGSKDRGVQFWDAHTAQLQCMLQGHKNSGAARSPALNRAQLTTVAVISIDLSPQGYILASGSGDCAARICKHFPLTSLQAPLTAMFTGSYSEPLP